METKQINIIPPQGMEILREIKDGIETISFKQIEEKKITYKDVCDKLFSNNTVNFIDGSGVAQADVGLEAFFDGNESLTEEEQEATLCEGMLRNVARYLNSEGWKYISNVNSGYYFYINAKNILDSHCNESTVKSNIYFQSEQLMNKAKEILGEDIIRKALIKQH